jgi:hypothetical protein
MMPLRGYAHPVLQPDGFRYVYCGLDGTTTLDNQLHLSWDHLLPKGHPNRDDQLHLALWASMATAGSRSDVGHIPISASARVGCSLERVG